MSDKRAKTILIVLTLTVVVSAGCVGPLDNSSNSNQKNNNQTGSQLSGNPIDGVPQSADLVFQADPVGFLEDPTTEEVANYILDEYGDSDADFRDELDSQFADINQQIQDNLSEENLDVEVKIEDFGRTVFFSDSQETELSVNNATNSYAGTIFELDLSEQDLDEFVDLAREEEGDELTIEKSEYNGFTTYSVSVETGDSEDVYLAILDEGLHTVGTQEVVQDVIDTYRGENPRAGEQILPDRDASTYLSFGSRNLNESLDNNGLFGGYDGEITLQSVKASYSTNEDDEIYVDTDVQFEQSQVANQSETQIQNQIDAIQQQSGEETSLEVLSSVDVSSDGENLMIDVNTDTEETKQAVDVVFSFFENLGDSFQTPNQMTGTQDNEANLPGVE